MAKKVSLKKSKIQRSDCTKNRPLRRQKSTNKVGCYRSGTVSFQWISTSSTSSSKQLWSTQILFHFNWVGGCEAEAVSLSPPPLLCALLHFYCHRGKSTLASARSFSRTAELFCNCNWEYSWQPTTIWNADLCLLLLEASVKRWWNLKWRRKQRAHQSCSFSGKKVKAIHCTSHLLLRPILCPILKPFYRQQTSATAARDEVPILAASNE